MRTRARVTAIPALLVSGIVASMPGVLKNTAAHDAHVQATPEAASVAAWADLGLPELNLSLTADGVEGVPESVEAGRYLLNVSGGPSSETSPGGIMLLQLPEGTSLDDAMASGDAGPQSGPPDFLYDSVLPGGAEIDESGSSVSVIDLAPGEWIVAGYALMTPPVMMTVTGELPADLPEPESNATFTMGEMYIDIAEGEIVAGENLLQIENAGDQPHFVTFERLPDGSTVESVEATLQAEMTGTPGPDAIDFADIIHVGSSADQSSGTTMWMPLTLEPGTYAGICFFPDRETGMPHAAMGMYIVFTVE